MPLRGSVPLKLFDEWPFKRQTCRQFTCNSLFVFALLEEILNTSQKSAEIPALTGWCHWGSTMKSSASEQKLNCEILWRMCAMFFKFICGCWRCHFGVSWLRMVTLLGSEFGDQLILIEPVCTPTNSAHDMSSELAITSETTSTICVLYCLQYTHSLSPFHTVDRNSLACFRLCWLASLWVACCFPSLYIRTRWSCFIFQIVSQLSVLDLGLWRYLACILSLLQPFIIYREQSSHAWMRLFVGTVDRCNGALRDMSTKEGLRSKLLTNRSTKKRIGVFVQRNVGIWCVCAPQHAAAVFGGFRPFPAGSGCFHPLKQIKLFQVQAFFFTSFSTTNVPPEKCLLSLRSIYKCGQWHLLQSRFLFRGQHVVPPVIQVW